MANLCSKRRLIGSFKKYWQNKAILHSIFIGKILNFLFPCIEEHVNFTTE